MQNKWKLPKQKQKHIVKKNARLRKKQIKKQGHHNKAPKKCRYCRGIVKLYKKDRGMQSGQYGYKCTRCYARVSCHWNTTIPKGILCNYNLRKERDKLHKLLDELWETEEERMDLYHELAKEMGVKEKNAHIGMMDEEAIKKAKKAVISIKKRLM